MTERTAAVIGAGISGLTAAYEYLRAEPESSVTVYEASERIGGLLKSSDLGGAVASADVGAEASLYVRPEARGLAEELGLEAVYPSREHSSQLFVGGKMHTMPKGTLMGVPGDAEALRGILADDDVERVADEQLTPAGKGDVSIGGFIADRLGDAVVDTVLDPLIGGVYSGRCRDLSMEATVPALLEAYREGAPVLETVQKVLAARTVASGANVPGTQAKSAPPVFMTLRGGINRLIDALADRVRELGGTITAGAQAVSAVRTDDGWTVSFADGSETAVDDLILAVPAYRAARLLETASPEAAQLLREVPYASSAVITALIELDGPLEGSGFLIPPTENRFIKASTYASNKWPWLDAVLPDGQAVIRISVGRFGDEPSAWSELPDDELARRAWADWLDIAGRSDTALHLEVQRWENSLPQFTPGHFVRVADIDRAASELPGLALVGNVYEGVGLPACISRAQKEVNRLREKG